MPKKIVAKKYVLLNNDFYEKKLCNELKVKKLIATKIDKNMGKLLSKNCYGC